MPLHSKEEIRMKSKKIQRIAAISGLLIVLAAILVCYMTLGKELVSIISDTDSFRAWLDSYGNASQIIFVAVRTVQTVVKIIPAEPLEIGSGYAFGVWGGLLWCMVGTMLGSLIIIALSKFFGTRFINLFVDESKLKSFSFLQKSSNVYALLFFIYLIPGCPKDLITYFVWMLPVKPHVFLIITGIARIPAILTSTMCGAALGEKQYLEAAIIFGVTTVLSIVGLFIYRKYEKKKNG